MNKISRILYSGFGLICLFFLTWFILGKVDWISIFHLKESKLSIEQNIGKLLLNLYTSENKLLENNHITQSLDTILQKICKSNDIDNSDIKLHIIDKSEINAFIIPDGHIVIYSGLLKKVESQGELVGVICHELAHYKLNHVMQKLIKEIGLSVLISLTTGRNNSDKIHEIAKVISSTAYDRTLEEEADLKAVEYMSESGVDPMELANFMYKITLIENKSAKYKAWFSTHPDSKERADLILNSRKFDKSKSKQILNEATWILLKKDLNNSQNF